MTTTNPLEERLISTNVGYFLREFSISRTKYTPPGGSEIEFADHVILIGDILFLIQAKNREVPSPDREREKKWYRDVVRRQAVGQLRHTLEQLRNAPPFPNDRDEKTNIPRDLQQLRVFKIVIYNMAQALPVSLRCQKHRLDDRAGFVHIFHIDDYELVLRTLVTVPEVTDYLAYREAAARSHTAAASVDERALLGGFLRYDSVVEPNPSHSSFVDNLLADSQDFDISGLLHGYRDKIYGHWTEGPLPQDVHTTSQLGPYYGVLRQLMRLPRQSLAQFKMRFLWAREKCDGEFVYPSLFGMRDPERGQSYGFVFVPIPKGKTADHANNALMNFTHLGKHHLQVDRMLGVSIRRDARDLLIDWALVQTPWQPNADLDQILRENNPFRSLTEGAQPRYHFRR